MRIIDIIEMFWLEAEHEKCMRIMAEWGFEND